MNIKWLVIICFVFNFISKSTSTTHHIQNYTTINPNPTPTSFPTSSTSHYPNISSGSRVSVDWLIVATLMVNTF